MGESIVQGAAGLDMSGRLVASTTVVASPTDNTEVIIASLKVPAGLALATGVFLVCQAAFTVGTAGVSANLRIRRTAVNGTAVAATGATTCAAAALVTRAVAALDTGGADGQLYKATLEVGSANAASTISSLILAAFAV